mgnify:FL=1|tara:strand:+ start:999 stop:1181 length:183 start_codon:yes stop_codon:yes gene_type:complete
MDSWLPSELTDEKDIDLVSLVSSSLEYDIDKTRAFVVALLTDVNDHNAATKVNDVLLGVE